MTINPADANEPWRFDDLLRRFTQALFAESGDAALDERRAQYRRGLLKIAEGLAADSFKDYDAGDAEIALAFRSKKYANVVSPLASSPELRKTFHPVPTIVLTPEQIKSIRPLQSGIPSEMLSGSRVDLFAGEGGTDEKLNDSGEFIR